MKYQPGQLLNFKYKNIPIQIGNLIHYGSWNSYTHSAIVLFTDKKGIFVAEALNKITGSYYDEWWLNAQFENGKLAIGTLIKKVDEKKLMNFYLNHVGDEYDYMALTDIAKFWFTGKSNVKEADDQWICSEFDSAAIRACTGLDIPKELELKDEEYCSPMDLMKSKYIKWEYK